MPRSQIIPAESSLGDAIDHLMRSRDLGDMMRGLIADWQHCNKASDAEIVHRVAGVLARLIAADPNPDNRLRFLLRMHNEFAGSVEKLAEENLRNAEAAGRG